MGVRRKEVMSYSGSASTGMLNVVYKGLGQNNTGPEANRLLKRALTR